MKETILFAEDDGAIREGIRILLEAEGFQVKEAGDGYSALEILTNEVDLVILDVMMPGISGIQTCEEIRKISDVPVLFLTAKDQETDKLLGFRAGGDDYLVKPFSYAELVARVKALLRRYRRPGPDTPAETRKEDWIRRGVLRVHTGHNEAWLRESELDLTEIEYRILLLLTQYPKKVFSVQNLYESIWQEPFVYTSANTVMVHIRHLRMKIEDDPQKPKMIRTVWGKGYCFEENPLS